MVEMRNMQEDQLQEQQQYGHLQQDQGPVPISQTQVPFGQSSTRKIPTKQDVIDSLCTSVNQDLLVSKTFYFFFFSAFGSLFPLLAVYFKQLGMNPTQCGLLIGLRPFVEFLSAPLWGSMADRFRKGKIMLLFSLFSWIVFTLSLAFIQPPTSSCVIFNTTHHVLYAPNTDRTKRSILEVTPLLQHYDREETLDFNFTMEEKFPEDVPGLGESRRKRKSKSPLPHTYVVGKSPNTVEYTLNFDQEEHTSYVSPPFSSMVFKWDDVQEVFFLLLLLVLLGELFSAPAITLADSVTLTYLGDNTDNYGKQRMFGSLGWGLAMFFVGIALDHSTSFTDHPCGPHDRERNYTICFATFSVLMGCALMAATQFRFDYVGSDDNIPLKYVQENGPHSQATVAPGLIEDGPQAAKEDQPKVS